MISEYFSLKELRASATADRLGLNNKPTEPHILANLGALANDVLDPIRRLFGVPVIVTSGYRSHSLNRAIGGSAQSQHCEGQAADIVVRGVDTFDAALRITSEDTLTFDQFIFECKWSEKLNDWRTWIHVSYCRHGNNRQQVLTAGRLPGQKKTTYTSGLHDPRIEGA